MGKRCGWNRAGDVKTASARYNQAMNNEHNLSTLAFRDQAEWEAWLAEHHADSPGIWLKVAKKGSGISSVTYAEALESALCFGWIDGQKAPLDDRFWLQRFTPRGPKSAWSKINREKALALIAAGRMQPAGLRQVELAKSDGRWDVAYASQRSISIPEDFKAALDANPAARDFFNTLNSANRYAILYRIHTSRKPATRAAWIQKVIDMLLNEKTIHPQSRRNLPPSGD